MKEILKITESITIIIKPLNLMALDYNSNLEYKC